MDSARQLLDEWAGTVKQPLKIPKPPVNPLANVPRKVSLPQKDHIISIVNLDLERP
jgi:hypothetical protein